MAIVIFFMIIFDIIVYIEYAILMTTLELDT